MKRSLIMGCIIGLLIAIPAFAAKEAPVKIGIIDTQKIMRQSKAAKNAQTVFMRDLESKRATLAAKEKEIQVMDEELKSPDQKLSPDARNEKGNKLNREVKELKRLAADLEEELKKKEVELTRKILGEVLQIVKTYAKKERYSLILEKGSVVTSEDALDITDSIIKLYDAGKK